MANETEKIVGVPVSAEDHELWGVVGAWGNVHRARACSIALAKLAELAREIGEREFSVLVRSDALKLTFEQKVEGNEEGGVK